jgi:hypothetical protein
MANNLIQIKRSVSNASVPSLANGELAFTQASNTLFIGAPDGTSGNIPIGTKLNYGVLTANAVLVANATSYIDTIKVANAVLDSITANGAPGSTGQVLGANSSGGIYWFSSGLLTTNVDAQYSWTNTQTFSNTITFNGAILANTANAITFTAGVYGSITGGLVANSTTIGVGNSSVSVTINSTAFSGSANNAAYLGGTVASSYATKTYADTAAGTAYTNAVSAAASDASTKAGTAYTNATSYADTKAGTAYTNATSYADTKAATAYSNATSYADTKAGTAYSNATSYADTKAGAAYSNAMSDTLSRNGSYTGNNSFGGTNTTFSSNVSLGAVVSFNGSVNTAIIPTANNTQDLGTLTKRWGTLYLAGSTIYLGNSSISDSTDGFTVANLVANAATVNTVIGTLTTINSNVTITSGNVIMSSANLSVKDVNVSGNLTVSGTLTTIDTNNLSVKDTNIKLADQNTTTDTIDFGFYGLYNSGATQYYSGLFRDHGVSTATNPVFHLFTTTTEPTSIVDTSAAGYKQGTLQSYLDSGAFVANSSAVNITANGTVSAAIVANSITLSTALAANYGGTGQTSYSTGDLLYASGSTALSKLSVPGSAANGQVLMITNNLPAYGTLDGGTF